MKNMFTPVHKIYCTNVFNDEQPKIETNNIKNKLVLVKFSK